MIHELTLEHFQSHANVTLELHPGVNAIIGPSNSGKSAILRALFWAVCNRPRGEAFVSHWNRTAKGAIKGKTVVALDLGGVHLRRERTKDFNGYRIEEVDAPNKTLEAIRTEVPPEVTRMLGMSEVNIQRQLDAPFLLSESPPEVARFFNRIIRLDLIDVLLSAAEARRRGIQKDLKTTAADVKRLAEEILEYDWIESATKLYTKAQNVKTRLTSNQEIHAALTRTLDEYRAKRSQVRAINSQLEGVEEKIRKAEALKISIQSDEEARDALQAAQKVHWHQVTILDRLGNLGGLDERMEEAARLTIEIDADEKEVVNLRRSAMEHRTSTRALKRLGSLIGIEVNLDSALKLLVSIDRTTEEREALVLELERHAGWTETVAYESKEITQLIHTEWKERL